VRRKRAALAAGGAAREAAVAAAADEGGDEDDFDVAVDFETAAERDAAFQRLQGASPAGGSVTAADVHALLQSFEASGGGFSSAVSVRVRSSAVAAPAPFYNSKAVCPRARGRGAHKDRGSGGASRDVCELAAAEEERLARARCSFE
jgi:hypothetical protein